MPGQILLPIEGKDELIDELTDRRTGPFPVFPKYVSDNTEVFYF